MIVLRSFHVPGEDGEVVQYFTWNERRTAAEIGRIWQRRGWKPTLTVKSYGGSFISLDSTLSVRAAA